MKVPAFIKITMLAGTGAALLFAYAAAHAQKDAGAPRVYFHTEAEAYTQGSEFAFTVLLDVPDEVNAADIEIGYSVDTLEFIESNDARSLINIWQKSPVAVQPGAVRFTGGMLKPFSGQGGQLVQLHFRAVSKGTATLALQKARVYRADGKGTLIEPPLFFITLPVTEGAPMKLPAVEDATPPALAVEQAQDPARHIPLLIFEAHDADSGVGGLLVSEKRWFAWSQWMPAASPLRVGNDAWMLRIRAVNGARQETVATVFIWQALVAKLAAGAVLLFLLIGAAAMVYNKKGKTT